MASSLEITVGPSLVRFNWFVAVAEQVEMIICGVGLVCLRISNLICKTDVT